jgi:hypothetical protein
VLRVADATAAIPNIDWCLLNAIKDGYLANLAGVAAGSASGALTAGRTTNYSVLSPNVPIGSYVNSFIIHCSLVNNSVVSPSDILDAFQITNTAFGSNINYAPTVEKFVKLQSGNYNSMIITLTDQNNNPITLLDKNILITILFRKKSKPYIR